MDRADLTRADRYFEVATAAGEWVENAAVSREDGRAWPTVAGKPETVDPSLLGAEAGVILFLVDLWRTTGSPEAAPAVVDAVRRIGALAPSADRWGLYDGLAGLALSAARAADALSDDDLGVTAASLVDQLLRKARPTPGQGLEWPALPPPDGRGPWNDLYRGLAGIGLVLLELDHRDEAVACGNRLVDLALRADVGCWWRSRPDDHTPAPNIAHGTTGIAYFLATLAIETGEQRYGQMALDGARYLLSIARTDGETCAVHHHDGDSRDIYTLGWCSGPPGLGCLFVRLHQLTGDGTWLTWAERAARTVKTSGIPNRLYPGFWDNVGHCCGSAGVADFMLGMSAATDDRQWRDFACVVLDDICDRAAIDEAGARWHNIEHRKTDALLPAQTGFMQGASGVAVALLRGARALRDGPLGPWLPSWPFAGGSY